ncbi:peptidoglycan-binding protein, partial [Streptomyces oryzae]
MHRRGEAALRGAAASAAVLLSAGVLAGCQAKDGAAGPAVRISKAPQQAPQHAPQPPAKPSTAPAHTNAPPKPVKPVQPAHKPEAAQPVAQAVRMAPGARGAHVRELQARLRQLGLFHRNPTGYYGPVTAGSVTAFQKQRGMPRTGKVTDGVLSALRARTHEPTRSELYPPTTR